MKKLRAFAPHERTLATLLKGRLEQEGVACLLRNEELFAALGEIPFLECRPELWVVDDEVLPRAQQLVDHWLHEDDTAVPWRCPDCGEELEGQFDRCWKCGRERR